MTGRKALQRDGPPQVTFVPPVARNMGILPNKIKV